MEPETLSASGLKRYMECPAGFRAEYVDRVRISSGGGSAGDLGSLLHECLEWWVIEGCVNGPDIAPLIKKCKELAPNYGVDALQIKVATKMLTAWLERWEADEVPFEVLQAEIKENFLLKVQDSRGEVHQIGVTYIWDRVDKLTEDGSIRVVDYKGVALDTHIPTPTGWATMADLQVGDQVFGGDGRPCQVIAKSDVHWNPCYRIVMDDGSELIADHEHRWAVNTTEGTDHVWTTEELAANLWTKKARPQRHLRIDMEPLDLLQADLPIDPYILGAWLGDGTAREGAITKPLPALWAEIERRGHTVTPETDNPNATRTVRGLTVQLREAGLLNNKHIPPAYLRASLTQRLDLLRGIMDTDGHWNPLRKRCVLVTVDKAFAQQVEELIVSLGWSAHNFEVDVHGYGLDKRGYQVWFTPHDHEVFLARRPDDYRVTGSLRSRRRLIKSVEPVPTIATQCIQVNSPDSTYLAGRAMIRTHNSWMQFLAADEIFQNLQCRVYALAAAIKYKDQNPPYIWVALDQLRYGQPTAVRFTKDDIRDIWAWLKSTYIKIIEDDGTTEIVGNGCRWCVRSTSCVSFQNAVAAGTVMSYRSPEDAARKVAEINAVTGALSDTKAQLLSYLETYLEERGYLEERFQDAGVTLKITPKRNRTVNQEDAVAAVGPELAARYGKLGVTVIDELLDGDLLDDEQKRSLRKAVSEGMSTSVNAVFK